MAEAAVLTAASPSRIQNLYLANSLNFQERGNSVHCKEITGNHRNVTFWYKGKKLFLSYFVQGEGNPPLVILPGLGGSHLEWEKLVLPYLEIKRRVIVLDLPGHGISGSLENATLDDLVEVVYRFLVRKRIRRAVFAGQSMGAAVGLMIAAKYPEITQGVLAQGAPYRIRDHLGILRGIAQYLRLSTRIYPPLADLRKGVLLFIGAPKIMAWVFETDDMLHMSSDAGSILRADARHVDPRTYTDLLYYMADFDLCDQLSRIPREVPVLLMDGDTIKIPTIDTLEGLSRLIPHAKTYVVKNAGHLAPLSHPQEFCGVLESFVKEVGG